MPISESGKWHVDTADETDVFILRDDFEHDAMLIVDGDFKDLEQKLQYAEEIAKRLNLYHASN